MSYDSSFKANLLEGKSRFQSARMRAFWDEMFSLLRGQPAELMSFEDIRTRLRLHEESYKGLQNIPVDKIVGSVGRYRDFTSNFLPKSSAMQERWSRIYAQANSLSGLPPIEVYKVGDVYFVRDGNHRVSVARQLRAKTIEAHVTELSTPVSLQPDISIEELDAATAYANFLSETGLRYSRPLHQSLMLSEPTRYTELMGHINLHRGIIEHVRGEQIDIKEAAAHWYDEVYRPALTLIRKYGVLENLPLKANGEQRTEADLYLWLVDHLQEVREQYGSEEETQRFSDALVDYLAERKIPVPKELLVENDPRVMITRTQVMRAIENKYGTSGNARPDAPDNLDTA